MEWNFRTAQLSDLDRVTEIEYICFPAEQAATRAAFEQRIKTFPSHFILLEHEGTPIGFVNGAVLDARYIEDEMYERTDSHNERGAYQSVYGLDVLPEYRGRGLAHKLMAQLIDQAKKEGRRGVTLTCLDEKIGFYETMGFKNEGVSDSSHGGVVWNNMILEF
ncbi:MAG: GNAT family N-acetyltransferase [Oscillospiraceae bacterium]|nr:GNAT family N-acetyltransferase [Eubacteriales bacterium]MDY2618747.1 GNAT family N-acetyltransferase [Oscillospiraceae bacterium]